MGGYEGSLKFGGKLDVGRVLSSFWLASFQSSLKICSPSVNFSSADFWSRCEHLRHRFPCTDKGEVHKVHDNFRKIRRVDANVPMSTCFRQPFSWMNLNRLQNFYWFWKNLFHESFTEAVPDVSVCTYFFDGHTSTTAKSYSRKVPLHWLLMPTCHKAETVRLLFLRCHDAETFDGQLLLILMELHQSGSWIFDLNC